MGDAPGDEDVLVGERDRRPPVELADEALEGRACGAALAGRAEPPEDAGRAADALERAEEEAVQLVVLGHDGHERELLDMAIEELVGKGQTYPCNELAELIELGRLEGH